MTFITVFAAPIGLETVGWKIWLWILSGNFVGVGFVYFLCPETGGKTLEDVDYLFGEGKRAWKMETLVHRGLEERMNEKEGSVEKIDRFDEEKEEV